jgi:hypothetical protein
VFSLLRKTNSPKHVGIETVTLLRIRCLSMRVVAICLCNTTARLTDSRACSGPRAARIVLVSAETSHLRMERGTKAHRNLYRLDHQYGSNDFANQRPRHVTWVDLSLAIVRRRLPPYSPHSRANGLAITL